MKVLILNRNIIKISLKCYFGVFDGFSIYCFAWLNDSITNGTDITCSLIPGVSSFFGKHEERYLLVWMLVAYKIS